MSQSNNCTQSAQHLFDYDGLLAAIEVFRVPSHPLPAPEVKLPKWRDNPMAAYNGFTGDERTYMWQLQTWLRRKGFYPKPEACSVCGSRTRIGYHSENYADLWNAIPICGGCHFGVHLRFTQPGRWQKRLSLHVRREGPPQWFDMLPPFPIDVAGWLRAKGVASFLWPE